MSDAMSDANDAIVENQLLRYANKCDYGPLPLTPSPTREGELHSNLTSLQSDFPQGEDFQRAR